MLMCIHVNKVLRLSPFYFSLVYKLILSKLETSEVSLIPPLLSTCIVMCASRFLVLSDIAYILS
jgi:hypothetical protein